MDTNFNYALQDFANGQLLLINKPYQWTSFDVVGKLRNSFKPLKLKVGHAGTLDPLATGLLIVCTGKMTKQIDTFQAEEKEYTGTLILGATTPSYDMETEVDGRFDISNITENDIHNAAQQFTGEIQQYPPAHSAIKVDGERLYEKARRGEDVEIKSRTVTITEFEITEINLPEVSFRVVCSKGTYIRSLVYDFGRALNNGAYLTKLCRTRSGNFKIEDAHDIMELVDKIKNIPRSNQADSKPLPNPPREGGLKAVPQDIISIEHESVRKYRENADPLNYELLKDFSKMNRHFSTEAENVLWQLLRRDATGFKVRRQHVIDNFISDFVVLQKGLVIEVDGMYHDLIKESDEERTKILNNEGFEVIRFKNDEILKYPQKVFDQIVKKLSLMPDKQLPPSRGGRGRGL